MSWMLVVVIIAGVAGFAGLVLDVLSRAALDRPSGRMITTGYRRRMRWLRVLRDIGRVALTLGLAVIIIIIACVWAQLGGR